MRTPARAQILELVARAEAEGHFCIAQSKTQSRQLARAVAEGVIMRPYPAVYASKEGWEEMSREQRVLNCAHSMGMLHPSWVFAGPTAALAHGLWVGWDYLDVVCTATTKKSHSSSYGMVRRIQVTGDEPVVRQSLRVTSFVRTVYDCIRTMAFPDALAIADSALRTKGISRERLSENVRELAGHKRDVGHVLDVIAEADGRSDNGGESVARAHMRMLGFVAPELQVEVVDSIDDGKGYRVDYLWTLPDEIVVAGELDGKDKYTDSALIGDKDMHEVLLAERRREARLTLADHPVRVMRFSLAEAKNPVVCESLLASYGVPRVVAVPPAVA